MIVVKVAFAVLLLVVLTTLLFVVIAAIASRASRNAVKPAPSDSNAQWAKYYRQMAEQAEQGSSAAAEYESLARMYETLDEGRGV